MDFKFLTSSGMTNSGGDVFVKPNETKYYGTQVLMTDSIFTRSIPEDAKGELFMYSVLTYETESKLFELKYEKKAIDPDGTEFYAYDKKDNSILTKVALATVKEAQERYLKLTTKTKKEENDRLDKAKKELEVESRAPSKVDLSDMIDTIISSDTLRGGTSPDILDLEFELVDDEGND